MLYRILKFLFFFAVKGYFRNVYVKGTEKIPAKGPLIFTANHPSAFMDPILLAAQLNRKAYFLARGDIFKNKLAAAFFKTVHMIPVFNRDVSPGEQHKNEEIFIKCFEHMEQNRVLIIFPEGLSVTERRLRPIKTGAARIALGAEERNDFNLGIHIIPVGMNYSNPHHFKSDVFVNFGDPISLKDWKDDYQKDERETVVKLTEKIKERLAQLTIIIEDERLDNLIKNIEILYRSKLRNELYTKEKTSQDFYLSKDIVHAVEMAVKEDPEKSEKFESKLNRYLLDLKRLKIRDTQVRMNRLQFPFIKGILFFVLGFPIFLFGYLMNIIPYSLSLFVIKKFEIREDFVGSIKLAGGMIIFTLWYMITSLVFGYFVGWWWSVLFFWAIFPAGLFTVNYIKEYYQNRGIMKFIYLFTQKSNLISDLKETRKQLVEELEEGRLNYLSEK